MTRRLVQAQPRDRPFPMLRFAEEVALQCALKALTPVDLGHLGPAVLRVGSDVMYVTTKMLPAQIFKLTAYQAARDDTLLDLLRKGI